MLEKKRTSHIQFDDAFIIRPQGWRQTQCLNSLKQIPIQENTLILFKCLSLTNLDKNNKVAVPLEAIC